jgi:hypothetical protein
VLHDHHDAQVAVQGAFLAGLDGRADSAATASSGPGRVVLSSRRALAGVRRKPVAVSPASGLNLTAIQSAASFLVPRVDTEVDALLGRLGTPEAASLRGEAAIANAQPACQAYTEVTAAPGGRNWPASAPARNGAWFRPGPRTTPVPTPCT